MTAPTDTLFDTFVEGAHRTQEAVTAAVRSWADTVAGWNGARPALPDAAAVVDRYFDAVQQVLDTQRSFAKTVIGAGAQAAEAVTEQAARATQSVATHTVNAAEGVAEHATKATKAATARNGKS